MAPLRPAGTVTPRARRTSTAPPSLSVRPPLLSPRRGGCAHSRAEPRKRGCGSVDGLGVGDSPPSPGPSRTTGVPGAADWEAGMPGARVRASATLGHCPPGPGRAAERGSPPSVFSARCTRRVRSRRQAAPSAASGRDLPAPRKGARGRCVWPAPPPPGCGDYPYSGARLAPVAWGPGPAAASLSAGSVG